VIDGSATAARLRGLCRSLSDRAEVTIAHPLVAYGAIAALEIRVLWNIWRYADLTPGDTSYYFVAASSWAHGLHENFVYYPLYDAFWGTILAVVHNIYAATIIQRIAIILAATLLVLALMRSLFGPGLGLFIAAWWAMVPANYAPLYEVHLFGAVPILLAAVVVARVPRRQGLGIAVAILFASSVLVRNELLAAALILTVVIIVYERRGRWIRPLATSYLRAYGVPLAIAALLVGGAYAQSYVQGNQAWQLLQAKEEANFCNDYAASFQEHHPSQFVGNPFTQCSPLMQQTFGRPMPTLFQGLAANPRAVAGFAAWNASLIPDGLQVSLLGATSFGDDPGFQPVIENSTYALLLSVLLFGVVAAALSVAIREGELSVRRAQPQAVWTSIVLTSIAAASLIIALTTRPWTEYIYGLSICAFVLIAWALSVLVRHLRLTRMLAPAGLVLVLALIVASSSHYGPAPRPIYDAVQRLRVVQRRLQRQDSVLVASANYDEICNYLARDDRHVCTATYWPALRTQVSATTSVRQVLDRIHATAIYATADMLADPILAHLVAAPRTQGWRQIAAGIGDGGSWRVLVRARRS
jgi:hypothetical protein